MTKSEKELMDRQFAKANAACAATVKKSGPSISASTRRVPLMPSGVRRTLLMRLSFVHSSHTVCQMPVVRV